jgi:uncharacterized protein (TIGR02001 family)
MTTLRAAALAATVSLSSVPALAQGLSFSGGMTVTSNYMLRGLSQSLNRPALQFWGEAETMGFYAGVWASSIRGSGTDRIEFDPYLGYRFSIGSASFDIGYIRYLYDRSGNCCGEFYANAEVEVDSSTFFGSLSLNDAHGFGIADIHLGVRYAFDGSFYASGLVGRSPGVASYGVLGVGYQVNPNVGFEAGYHITNAQRNQLVVSSNITF